MCDRFRRLISSPDFQVLGTTGKGSLTISGGIAVFPYDATTAEGLIEAAETEAELHRRVQTLVAETESERAVLEARLGELSRRLDETVARAQEQLAALVGRPA